MKQFFFNSTFQVAAYSQKLCFATCLLVVCYITISTKPAVANISLDSQAQCLVNLSSLEGVSSKATLLRHSLSKDHKLPFSFLQYQKVAIQNGMKVVTKKITLSDLRKMNAPAIVRLNNPDEIVTLAAVGQQNAIVYEGRFGSLSCERNFTAIYW